MSKSRRLLVVTIVEFAFPSRADHCWGSRVGMCGRQKRGVGTRDCESGNLMMFWITTRR